MWVTGFFAHEVKVMSHQRVAPGLTDCRHQTVVTIQLLGIKEETANFLCLRKQYFSIFLLLASASGVCGISNIVTKMQGMLK